MTTLDHGDGRTASRFRPDWTPDYTPRVVGMCASCLRSMWMCLPQGGHAGRVTVSTDGLHCNPCLRYIRDTGGDPRDKVGAAAERLPVERAESDDSWRDDPRLIRCAGLDDPAFDPDPFPDETSDISAAERDEILAARRYIARRVCSECPVKPSCRGAAIERGFEGLWGGGFFERKAWTDLDTGVRFPTRYTPGPVRRMMAARLERDGWTTDGRRIEVEGGKVAVA